MNKRKKIKKKKSKEESLQNYFENATKNKITAEK